MLSIKSRESNLIQVPSKENKFVAICQVKITTQDGQSFMATSSYQPEDESDLCAIVEVAEDMAYDRAIEYAQKDLSSNSQIGE